jgi:hypothetical protein
MSDQALVVREEAPPTEGGAFLAMLAQAARDPSVDVAKMQAIMDMCERQRARVAETEFSEAMGQAQSEMGAITRDGVNEFNKSRYARLETIDAKIRPIYTRHGFSLSFNTAEPKNPGSMRVVCDVMHRAGHTKRYELEGELDTSGSGGKANKTGIQALGSSSSYLRRYLTLMVFNLVLSNEDNDGNKTDPGWLSEIQLKNVNEKIAACEMQPAALTAFLKFAEANSVREIRALAYDRVMAALRAKEKQHREGGR